MNNGQAIQMHRTDHSTDLRHSKATDLFRLNGRSQRHGKSSEAGWRLTAGCFWRRGDAADARFEEFEHMQ